MELYNLGKTPWEDSQLIYHALARLGREALVLVSPASPYVCLGFHQDAEQEVDLDFCRSRQPTASSIFANIAGLNSAKRIWQKQ